MPREGSQDHPVWPINFSSVPPLPTNYSCHTTHTPTQTGQPHPPSSYELCFPASLFTVLSAWDSLPCQVKSFKAVNSQWRLPDTHKSPAPLLPLYYTTVSRHTRNHKHLDIRGHYPHLSTPNTLHCNTYPNRSWREIKLTSGLSKSHKGIILSKITIVSKQEPSL